MAVLFVTAHAVDQEPQITTPIIETSTEQPEVTYVDDDSNEDVSDYDSDDIYAVEKGTTAEEVVADDSIHDLTDPADLNADPSQPVLHIKALISGLLDDINRRARHPSEPELPEISHRNQRKRAWGGRDLERRHSRGYALDG